MEAVVVMAHDEEEARQVAAQDSLDQFSWEGPEIWLNPKLSYAERLDPDDSHKTSTIIRSFTKRD